MAVLKARISGAWVPVGGGPSGGGTDEVVISATEPPLAETELWYDTSAASTPFGLTANPNNALGIVAQFPRLPGPSITVTASASTVICGNLNYTFLVGRRYRIVCFIRAIESTSIRSADIIVCDGATQLTSFAGATVHNTLAALTYSSMRAEWVMDGNGVTYTALNLRATTNVSSAWYIDIPSAFYIEDIGPNGSPALPIPTTPPAWIPVTFENGWQNYPVAGFAPGSYRKIGDEVQLRGLVMGGTVNMAICTLPVGFRPAVSVPAGAALHLPVVSNAAFGWVHMYADGKLNATSVNNGWVDLSPLRFSVTY